MSCSIDPVPSALVIVVTLPLNVWLPSRTLTVSVRLPFALRTVTPVRVCSNVPLPSASIRVVLDRPLALVVVTV